MIPEDILIKLGRQTYFSVDLDLIESNVHDMRTIVGGKVKIAAVLKADAYGHGAIPAAEAVLRAGADMLAVATVSEGLELRAKFVDAAILVMGHTPDEFAEIMAENRIMPTLFDVGNAEAFSAAARKAGIVLPVHIKLDTGMNRLGIKKYENPVRIMTLIAAMPGLGIQGTYTHLALRNRVSDEKQFTLFMDIIEQCLREGIAVGLRHVCDSIGTVRYPAYRLDLVRVGAALFGVRPMRMGPEYNAFPFPQAGTFITKIARIRKLAEGEMVSYDDSWKAPAGGALVATLPVGYADGYPRCFGNVAEVVIRGSRAPVIGLVCMDQMMVDVGGIENVCEGDEVVLWGGRDISLLEASSWGSTNRNDLICGIGKRVPRLYIRDGKPLPGGNPVTLP